MSSGHPLGLSMSPVSEEVYRRLEEAFPQLEITPNDSTIDDVMYNAGQRHVIAWLQQFRQRSIVTGQAQ